MDSAHQLTPLQLAVMRVLWDRGEATVAEVVEALRSQRELAQTTVATLLARLEKRELVEHRTEGRQFVYRAAVEEVEARRSMVEELNERLFDGDVARLVSHLLAEHELAPGDLARVRELIDAQQNEEKVR
jgi:predicted transcriptional regulator